MISTKTLRDLAARSNDGVLRGPAFDAADKIEAQAERIKELEWEKAGATVAAEEWKKRAKKARDNALREAAHECEQVAYSGKYPQDDQIELGCLRCRDNILALIEGDTTNQDQVERVAKCHDCARPYGHEHGFPDLIIPIGAWERISPNKDDSGLLCPSCICARLHKEGIKCSGAFMSGPVRSIDQDTMYGLRWTENLRRTLARIEGDTND